MLVLAQSTRCVCAPLAARASPTRPRENLQIALVRQLAIGDGNFAQQALQFLHFLRICGSLQPVGEVCIDGIIDAADEEAGYTGDAADTSPPLAANFSSPRM